MALSIQKYFATNADDAAVGTRTWVNVGNIGANDAVYANVSMSAADSHYAKSTNASFGIPTTATIRGIVLEIEGKDTGATGAISDKIVRLVKGGTVSGDNKFNGDIWTASDTVYTYGSSTDLWGLSLTPTDVNASNFGSVLQVTKSTGGFGTANVDYVRMTVYYDLPTSTQSIIIF